jgi:hypothetical protein
MDDNYDDDASDGEVQDGMYEDEEDDVGYHSGATSTRPLSESEAELETPRERFENSRKYSQSNENLNKTEESYEPDRNQTSKYENPVQKLNSRNFDYDFHFQQHFLLPKDHKCRWKSK